MKNNPLPRLDTWSEWRDLLLPYCRLRSGEIWQVRMENIESAAWTRLTQRQLLHWSAKRAIIGTEDDLAPFMREVLAHHHNPVGVLAQGGPVGEGGHLLAGGAEVLK